MPPAPSPSPSPVEAPSGKTAGTENFPVGSILIAKRLRPHVATFYAFARAIDDIGDAPELSADEKIARLDGFEAALTGRDTTTPGYAKAHAMRDSLRATGVPDQHGVELIAAFKQDAVQSRYADWDDLMGYCRLSAAPVGRYLIDLHGGSRDGYGPSDALCAALQVINHLQDCQDDYRTLDRVYLPQDWMGAAGARVADLDAPAATPALRRVLDQCLDGCRTLMREADALPAGCLDRRLGLESAVIVDVAHTLIGHLSRQDPLSGRVKLSKGQAAVCALRGVARGLIRR
ncbi:squalene synthase HpnC [Roseospira marina]|uniref:Squalene synthase HpnC n=1 Tax=Roseospira marina TaxID=140057 RepID=A0A5M6IE11_9PROT|nr:squalene synthase HpnC [Roseospira marina]KAA5606516.1 squalene synthase HpnC [Roseospira marina]MBB4314060.1 squalene synthase HpnC [Roseospira marina]MBB5087221.1 squalene synthase HpnC [Roseospira marina]